MKTERRKGGVKTLDTLQWMTNSVHICKKPKSVRPDIFFHDQHQYRLLSFLPEKNCTLILISHFLFLVFSGFNITNYKMAHCRALYNRPRTEEKPQLHTAQMILPAVNFHLKLILMLYSR